MTPNGGGPSRRSHTKSRKGCKTCKRRHIRCDEQFPQCKNCSKHQVRCDYHDSITPDQMNPSEPPTVDLQYPQEIEHILDQWQRTGVCSLGTFSIDLHAQGHQYSPNDLRLIYHALWSGSHPFTNEFTVWTGKTPKFLSAATSQPFLVHAILAFGSTALAWERNSVEAKKLAYHHAGIALQGLQAALSTFSPENADAVLSASILLSWQANDWTTWSSLVSGIRTIINSMQIPGSYLYDIVLEQERSIPKNFPGFSNQLFAQDSHCTRSMTLNSIHTSIADLQQFLYLRDEEVSWVEQLKDYIQQLQGVRPAATAEDQFNHLYTFRKWLFWIPTALLKTDTRDFQTLLILAYYYATALQLEPLYPNVAAAFCSTMVVKPLEEIFRSCNNLQSSPLSFPNQHTDTLISLLAYPRQAFAAYKERRFLLDQSAGRIPTTAPLSFDRFNSSLANTFDEYRYGSHNSPAFPPPLRRQISEVSSVGLGSPYLDVPSLNWDDSSASSTTGSISLQRHSSSYTLPSMSAGGFDDSDIYGFKRAASMDFNEPFDKAPHLDFGGFVQSPPMWV